VVRSSDRSITADRLTVELDRLAVQRGYPAVLRCDNGPELAWGAMAHWAGERVGIGGLECVLGVERTLPPGRLLQHCEGIVSGLAAVVPVEAPGTATAANVLVTGTVNNTCPTGAPGRSS
jgi:hypothetical protein